MRRKLKHVQELLVTIYGPDWLPGLEADAKRASRKPAKKTPSMRSDLPIAVRVYPDLPSAPSKRKATPQIDGMLVFDCETRTDKAQALTFGSYRFLVAGPLPEEGLFYGDDLLPRERAVLERYVAEPRSRHRSARHSGARYSE